MDDLQKQVDNLIHDLAPQAANPYWSPLEMLANLTEEVGELARSLSHKYGQKKKKATEEIDSIPGEIADVYIRLACIANTEGVDITQAVNEKIAHIRARDKERFLDQK